MTTAKPSTPKVPIAVVIPGVPVRSPAGPSRGPRPLAYLRQGVAMRGLPIPSGVPHAQGAALVRGGRSGSGRT